MPTATRPEVRRTVGKIEREDSVTLTSPGPIKKGTRVVPSGAVGLRAATTNSAGSPKVDAAMSAVKQKLASSRSERQRAVWDKLDSAHKKASAKQERINVFQNPHTKK
jgi:hypothetical protein